MALDELMAEMQELVPGARLVDDLSNSNRAVLARVASGESTFVAKRHREESSFANEVEALRTLPADMRPELVAVGERVVVMEDLGTGPSLADLLLGDDPAAAENALLTWATTLGGALKPTLREGIPTKAVNFDAGTDALHQLASDFAVDVPGGLDNEIESIKALVANSSPWLAFCPSDTCPDNNRVMPDGSIKFFDFEGAAWRHAATEAAYCRAPFCTCWCVAALPDGMTDAMEAAFMAALSPPDPEGFRAAVGPSAIAYALRGFAYFRYFLDSNAPIGPGDRAPSTGRQYVHARLRFMASNDNQLPAIAQLTGGLADAMLTRWPESTPFPRYPAFRCESL